MAHLFMMCFRILEQREKKKIYILKSKFKLKMWTTKKRELPLSFLHSLTKITTLCNSVSGLLLAWMLSTQKQQKRNSFLELYMCWTLGKKKIRHIVDRSHPPCTYPVLNYKTIKRESKSELSSKIRRVKPETGSCLTQLLIRNSWKNFWSLITSYDLWKSPGPNLLLKQCHLKVAAQDHVQTAFELLQGGKLHPNVILVEDRIPMFPCWQNAQHIFWRAHYTMGEEWADGSSSEGFRKWSYIRLAASP